MSCERCKELDDIQLEELKCWRIHLAQGGLLITREVWDRLIGKRRDSVHILRDEATILRARLAAAEALADAVEAVSFCIPRMVDEECHRRVERLGAAWRAYRAARKAGEGGAES